MILCAVPLSGLLLPYHMSQNVTAHQHPHGRTFHKVKKEKLNARRQLSWQPTMVDFRLILRERKKNSTYLSSLILLPPKAVFFPKDGLHTWTSWSTGTRRLTGHQSVPPKVRNPTAMQGF